jgi:uncharacterized membrane protein YbjE (DUF340 family)
MIFNYLKYDNPYDIFIIFILIIKIIHFILAIILLALNLYNKRYHSISDKTLDGIKYWSDRIDFIFYALISLLIIYIFNPFYHNLHLIDFNVKLLLFVFGFIYLSNANWSIFFKSSNIIDIVKEKLN